MQNLIPLKKTLRLSRFSQNFNFNADFLKNFQSFTSKSNLDNCNSSQTDEQITTKKSIFMDQKRASRDLRQLQDNIKQTKSQDLFQKENTHDRAKFYEIDELKIYRQTMLQLPFLQDKSKKIKFKHICSEFIEFFFQIMKSVDVIEKIFSSFVQHSDIISEFLKTIGGFQLKRYNPGRTIEIGKDEEYFYIFVEGITEKATVKTASRLERKSFCESFPLSTSIVRRSGLKTKTITSKGKVACFEENMPLLINQKQFNYCSLKTSCECTFLLLQKSVWNKFLIQLQKLQEKHLVSFIKQWTSINLNISTINQLTKKQNSVEKKTFLYNQKHPKSDDSDSQSQNITSDKIVNDSRKITIHGNVLSSTYKLFDLAKDAKIKIDNQNVYLIVKGTAFLNTNLYSLIINQGSIINTSILLNLSPQNIQIKALTDCSIVKLILDEIYFKKQDQNDFIKKIKEIESFRNQINKVSESKVPLQSQLQNLFPSNIQKTRPKQKFDSQDEKYSSLKIHNQQFSPSQLKMYDLNIKDSEQNLKNPKKSRISHYYQKCKTQPCSEQSSKKFNSKFANNYFIFQKIVESKKKVSESYKINTIKKIFPIKDLIQSQNLRKTLDLETKSSHNSAKRKTTFAAFSQQKQNQECNKINTADSFGGQIQIKQNSSEKKMKSRTTTLQLLKKRRNEFEKILSERKKKQKSKIIESLFQIQLDQNIKKSVSKNQNQNIRFSLENQLNRVSNIIRKNQENRFSFVQRENLQNDFFNEIKQEKGCNFLLKSKTSRGKFDGKFLITEPNFNEMKKLQKIISGQNLLSQIWQSNRFKNTETKMDQLPNQNYVSNDFLKMKKMTTRKIKTVMLNGRIRDSKVKI